MQGEPGAAGERVVSCKHFQVSGRVQGVGFRWMVRDAATRLGVTGWVRNRPDGDVELVACGDATSLAELEAALWQGPPAARVDRVISGTAQGVAVGEFVIR